MPGRLSAVKRRLKWWYAKRRGTQPRCDCGNAAVWYATDAGYTCIQCEEQRGGRVAMLRDIQPHDYLMYQRREQAEEVMEGL